MAPGKQVTWSAEDAYLAIQAMERLYAQTLAKTGGSLQIKAALPRMKEAYTLATGHKLSD